VRRLRRARALRRRYGHAGLKAVPPPGTKVRMTGIFLKNTGQHRGREGASRWTVLPWEQSGFPGAPSPDMVVVNQPEDPSWYSDIRSTRSDGQFMRRIHKGNLEIVGAKPKAEDYP